MEETNPEIAIAFTIFFIVIAGFMALVAVALTRWIFRINKQIELLSQIKDELIRLKSSGRKLNPEPSEEKL